MPHRRSSRSCAFGRRLPRRRALRLSAANAGCHIHATTVTNVTDAELSDYLRSIERERILALVEGRADDASNIHTADFELVHPTGGVWSKSEYIGGIASGEINYRQFEPISDIEVLVAGGVAVLRYQSEIDISVGGQRGGLMKCWHLDCYVLQRDDSWRVRWSQATEILSS